MIALGLATGLTACLLSFQLALDRHFVRAGRMPRAAMALAILSTAVYAVALVRLWMAGAPSSAFSAAAAVVMLGSFLLFHVTRRGSPSRCLPVAFEAAAPRRLATEGPHRFIRHPFYVAYMLYWVAVVLSAPYMVTLAGAASIIVIYVVTAAREEQRLLNSPLGAEYREYQRRTGRFIPRPKAFWKSQPKKKRAP
jgi:protein-S-isoprenylcysteine O-methyltransferase Ste14